MRLRHIAYPKTRLEFNPNGTPSKPLFRVRRTALEIEVPEGRIEFFRLWEEPKVTWITGRVHQLLYPQAEHLPSPHTDNVGGDDVVISTRLYVASRAAC